MEYELPKNELEPIHIRAIDVDFLAIVQEMMKNPEKVQPVMIYSSDDGEFLSEFFMGLILEETDMYVQLEGFSSPSYEQSLLTVIEDKERWTIVQPGIFRLRMSD